MPIAVVQTSTHINRDVWREILCYFRFSPNKNELEDGVHNHVEIKQRALLSVALTCLELAELALDEIWRTMTTIEPVVKVFGGSFRFCPEGYWEVDMSPTGLDVLASRVQTYLKRIQYLHFQCFPSYKQLSMWQTLCSLMKVTVLCPNLRKLYLDLQDFTPTREPLLFPTISASLEVISFINVGEGSDTAVYAVLNVVRAHNVRLTEITYHGTLDHKRLRQVLLFSSLRSMAVLPTEVRPALLSGSELSRITELQALRQVELDMSSISGSAESLLGQQLSNLPVLLTLILHGTPGEIENCIFNENTDESSATGFPSLQYLLVKFKSQPQALIRRKSLFSHIASRFPKIHTLDIEKIGADGRDKTKEPPRLKSVLDLKPRLMKKIKIAGIPFDLDAEGVIALLRAWPQLEDLSLHPPQSPGGYPAPVVLSYICSHNSALRSLGLPLDLSVLRHPSITPLKTSQLVCPLMRLDLFETEPPSLTVKEKLDVVRNLLAYFPRLSVIRGPNTGSDMAADLQAMLTAFRDIIAFPPSRPDRLFRLP
ncbi:hypothetical protein NP233_g5120 [Leucocoprinus birnbaumii]|uniref:F-box domain-containing protein n=1 Tax=Leucocoprinus birnbaumii TaxID=56174 RepID=A0AAD5VX40_9AGAR|nr:hypothetical protein NP233_g5120 [Leucocoprinus birnbaumii]